MTAPIRPASAPFVWVSGKSICFELPSTVDKSASHSVTYPNTPEGLANALEMLRHRSEGSGFSSKADPTQAQIDRSTEAQADFFLNGGKVRKPISFSEATHQTTRDIMKRLGII